MIFQTLGNKFELLDKEWFIETESKINASILKNN